MRQMVKVESSLLQSYVEYKFSVANSDANVGDSAGAGVGAVAGADGGAVAEVAEVLNIIKSLLVLSKSSTNFHSV